VPRTQLSAATALLPVRCIGVTGGLHEVCTRRRRAAAAVARLHDRRSTQRASTPPRSRPRGLNDAALRRRTSTPRWGSRRRGPRTQRRTRARRTCPGSWPRRSSGAARRSWPRRWRWRWRPAAPPPRAPARRCWSRGWRTRWRAQRRPRPRGSAARVTAPAAQARPCAQRRAPPVKRLALPGAHRARLMVCALRPLAEAFRVFAARV